MFLNDAGNRGGEDGCNDAVNPGYAGPHCNKGKHIQGAVT